MKKSKKILPLILALFMIMQGCSSLSSDESSSNENLSEYETIKSDNEDYKEEKAETFNYKTTDVDITAEAENFIETSKSNVVVSQDRKGYSGNGYLTASNEVDSTVIMNFNLPSTQHYDITCCVASSGCTKAVLKIGEITKEFTLNETQVFNCVTFEGIYLEEGNIEISFEGEDGTADIDYVKIKNNVSIESLNYKITKDKSKSGAAEKLLDFLRENYGEQIISGQYVSSSENKELDYIKETTGRYPVIRFDDISPYISHYSGSKEADVIESCINWSEQGGINGLMFYWESPYEKSSVYAGETDFSLSSAISTESLSMKTEEEIEEMYNDGTISESCYNLIKDMDDVAKQLQILKEKDIPVLWRPLHEAGGGWYWWGASGSEEYKWLWQLMYYRYTDYFNLDNLIWVWNGQSESYMPDSDLYDIASLDIYSETEDSDTSEEFLALNKTIEDTNKITALSETGIIPDLSICERDNCKWSFFGLWYEDYLYKADTEKLSELYNSPYSMTLDEFTKEYN